MVVTLSPLYDAVGTVDRHLEHRRRRHRAGGDARRAGAARRSASARSCSARPTSPSCSTRTAIITYASPAVERFGYRPEEVVGRPSRDLIHPDDVERHRDTVCDDGGAHRHRDGRVALPEWPTASYRWIEEVLTDMHDAPAVGGWVANIRDITDRRQAEAERTEAEERFRQGFERSAFGLAVLDLEQTFTSVNPALADLLGRPVDQLLGRRPSSSCTRPRARARAAGSSASCAATRRSTSASTAWCAPTAASCRC